MIATSEAFNAPEEGGAALVGRIPVRNLWLLLLYASDLYRIAGVGRVAWESSPDDLPDLVAEILAREVEVRLRRRLSLGYQEREEVLGRVRGRIDLLTTERRQLLARGAVACRFDDLTVDTKRNRFVRGALGRISRLARRTEVSHRCRRLAGALEAMGVSGELPTRAEMSADRMGRNDAEDQLMVAAARLAFELMLPNEDAGPNSLRLPDREGTWVRRLFEKAVGGFYEVALRPLGWEVRRGERLKWQIERRTAGIDEILPGMQTDIVLDHVATGRRIVVDTKFTSILTDGWHREEMLRSGYVYQIYSYLRSQVRGGDPLAERASGLLLHPSVGKTVDEAVVIQGHQIRFLTVDLAASTSEIRKGFLRADRSPLA